MKINKVVHFEKDDYPGGFQVESLCGVKAIFKTEGDCMITSKDMRDYMMYGNSPVEDIITCNRCRKLYLELKDE